MMTDTKFTPGPWEQDPSDECAIMSENGAIATVLTGHDFPCLDDYEQLAVIPECEANARLIAAAPELYEALAELWNYAELSEAHFALATAALAKARGVS